jgi:Carbamoylphosphate synthase small subunit
LTYFLVNGPGDPEACHYAVKNIKELLKHKIPIFGICLGFQLLGISVGGKAIKMKFGHHGANHPVIDLDTKKVLITSQNHGFMIDEKSLPSNIRLTHRSLFDDSLQGIELSDCYAYGFQGHPEASPGPHDIHHIFNKFINFMKESKNA